MALKIPDYRADPTIASIRYRSSPGALNDAWSENGALLLGQGVLEDTKSGACFDLATSYDAFKESLCDGDIVSVNAHGIVHKIYDRRERNATVFITGKCNSNCIMCPTSNYERMKNDGMPDSWLRKYMELLPPDVPHIVVTGGEPTLKISQFFMAMGLIADRFPHAEVLLLTNGRSFASRGMVERLLISCPPHLTAGIPIHADDAVLHDAITQVPRSFVQTLIGIHNLLEAGVSIELRVVVSRLNYTRLTGIAELIRDEFRSVSSVKFMGLETLGNCLSHFDRVYMSCSESWKYVKPAAKMLVTHGVPVEIYNYPLCAVDRGYWALCRKSITPHKVRFPAACDECDMQPYCGGFFASTLARAKPEVCPIQLVR